ncbi:MAG: O-antigen ligase family protein [Planctomycetes bacterium]|nr:O-antigen ligase family protein [Planctomycetota bacterium]MBI3834447.1 O-antigen ligase family protein [Planctomycetota bacterium]
MFQKLLQIAGVDNRMSRILYGFAFITLVVIAALRPLIAETYDSSPATISLADHNITDPQPIRTLVIDLAILAAGLAWAGARLKPNVARYRWTGLEPALIIIACASVLSCTSAGNKRLAINASIDWLCSGVLGIVLVQVIRTPWQRNVLLAAVLATAAVQFTQCVDQRASTEDTWKQYQQTRAEFWRKQGIDSESNHVALFEARMRANESSGYLPHSNVTGSYFAMCGLAAVGVTIATWRNLLTSRRFLLFLGLVALMIALLAGIAMTKSRGAATSFVLALILWLVVWRAQGWIDSHRRQAFMIGWIGLALILVAVVGHGIYHGTLPTDSLAFRWHYWRNSMGMICDHWFAGVGRENFGRQYLLYKPIESPEEISNPHDVFVQAAAEWGIFGLIGIVALLLGASWALTMGRSHTNVATNLNLESLEALAHKSKASALRLGLLGIIMAVALTVIRMPLFGTCDRSYLYYMSTLTAIVWLPIFACVAFALSCVKPEVRKSVALAGAAFGLFAFALQELINFSLFVPATATTAFAVFACAIPDSNRAAIRRETTGDHRTIHAVRRWLLTLATTVAIVMIAPMEAVPVFRTGALLSEARSQAMIRPLGHPENSEAANFYERAAAADTLDPTAFVELARWLGSIAPLAPQSAATFSRAVEFVQAAQQRDKYSHSLRRLELLLCRDQARRTSAATNYEAAIHAGDEMLKLYPLDPAGLVLVGELQLEAARATNSDLLRFAGLDSLQKGLDLDSRRPRWSVFQGLTESERARVSQEIANWRK